MEKKVFISYSSKEMKVARQVCEYLESNGVSCWIAPRNINPGDNYATQIVHAIRDCSVLVLLASDSTNASGHVSNEVSLAFDNKKVIIPFKIEDIKFTDEYLYFLGRKHWIEAHLDMKSGFEQLLSTVEHLLGGKRCVDSPVKAPVIQVEEGREDKITSEEEHAFDRSIEIEEAYYSRDEIVERILNRARKYFDTEIMCYDSKEDFDEKKEYANDFLKMIFSVHRYNKPIEIEKCIDYIVDEILGDDDSEVIKIAGLPGSGKSILMQGAFYQALYEFKEGRSCYIPFYISLGYFEKSEYDKEKIQEQANALINKEMAEFFTFITKNRNYVPIVFIDEVREHNAGKISLDNILMDILKKYRIRKRVIAIDSGLIKNRNKIKRVVPIISEKVSALFEARKIDSHNERQAREFIKTITAFYDYDVDSEEVFDVLKKLKYQEVDVFTVRTIADELLSSPTEITSISDLYEKWALTELYGDEDELLRVAKTTFEYLFDNDFQIDQTHFNDPQWVLIHKHQSYIDLLISYYLIKQIEKCDRYEEFQCDLFKIMLTSSTDMFVGSFLESDYRLQEKIYNIVINNYDNFETVQRSSAVFWLSKLTSKNLVMETVKFLKARFDEMKAVVKNDNRSARENLDNQFLFRALSITLVVFEQTSVLDDYLCLLVINNVANAINRGAIIEYYGDSYQMAANDTYYLDADERDGARAIKALTWKINKALQPGSNRYPELDLLTLASLLQMRMQSNKSKRIPELRGWVEETATFFRKYKSRPQNISSAKIEFYFDSVIDDFGLYLNSEHFDISQHMYNTLRNLRDIKRKQWVMKDIEDPESVSEHSYSSWILAMLFLPEELNYDDYSKKEVLDMLLIHDMAEAMMGDQVLDLNEPTKELSRQNSIMRKLMVKGTYPNMANLTYYYNVWTGYFNGININAKIARDINLIQTVYTFFEYNSKFPEKFSDEDRERWSKEKRKIETDVGYSIYEILVENNIDYNASYGERMGNSKELTVADKKANAEIKEKKKQFNITLQKETGTQIMSYEDLLNSDKDMDAVKIEIANIVNSVIDPENNEGLENSLSMLENISENWRVILDKNGVIVGYWVFVALQQEYFERAKIGELNEEEITLETIEFIDFPGVYKGYLLLSGIKPQARTAELVQRLYDSMILHFQELATRGIFFDEICGIAESPMGMSALRKLGMSKVCEHQFGGTVHLCDMRNISNNAYLSSFEELTRLYQKQFNK